MPRSKGLHRHCAHYLFHRTAPGILKQLKGNHKRCGVFLDIVHSVNNIPIRVTRERWFHIAENHDDLAGYYDNVLDTIENPDLIIQGYGGALIAVKGMGRKRYLSVIYKEFAAKRDGFVISAYFTSKIDKRKILWPEKN